MSVPTNPKLRQVASLVDKVSNFGSWPPTEAYRDVFHGQGVCLNLQDASLQTDQAFASQIDGIRSHFVWAGVWHPVPPAGDDGAARAKWIHDKITAIDKVLVAQGKPKIELVWLNLEGYTISQWREFIWGRPMPMGPGVKGWRGVSGVKAVSGGWRSGFSTGIVDEPFKDGSVKPHPDFLLGRFELAVEGFYGPTSTNPDMTPADHPQAIADRVRGFRSDGTIHTDEAYPADQVVGCYDAALGSVVENPTTGQPAEPILIRHGLHFTLERARQVSLI